LDGFATFPLMLTGMVFVVLAYKSAKFRKRVG
jgi:hypothetical protein